MVHVGELEVGNMTYDVLGPGALDYLPCRYGTSRLIFRGPLRRLDTPYLSFLGGTQTFGKFIEQPFPLRVEHMIGVPSINLGQVNAGLDVFLKDGTVQQIAKNALATVLEAPGAGNMSNLLYVVHPRRNDRFLRASSHLRSMYPEVDFTRFNFTQHMLLCLYQIDPDRFRAVKRILRRTWLRKMKHLLARLGSTVVLLRIGCGDQSRHWHNSPAPVFVTDEMLEAVRPMVRAAVKVEGLPARIGEHPVGMAYNLMDDNAAHAVAGPQTHAEVSRVLLPILDRIM